MRVEIARKGSGWHERAPVERELAGDEVDMANTLVGALTRGLGIDARAIDPKEPFTPKSRAKLVRFENQGEEIVELGTDAKGGFVVHRLMDHARISLSADLARRMAPSQIALRGRSVLSPPLEAGDFVYFDPPYVPASETADFTSYAVEGFGANEQTRLVEELERLRTRGVFAMLSNADTPHTRALYKDFHFETVDAPRSINANGAKRGTATELIVTNWGPKPTAKKPRARGGTPRS